MRTDRRYSRAREMLTDEAVPRLQDGGLALCHHCQCAVYFAGGFLELLTRTLKHTIRHAKFVQQNGGCSRCGCMKIYKIERYDRRRCAECRYEWSATSGSAMHARKKPAAWYVRILAMRASGMNPRQISIAVGSHDAKSVYAFLRRVEISNHLANALTSGDRND